MKLDRADIRRHRSDLLRYVRGRVGEAALSEDIVQEAFVRLLAYQARPESSVSNVAALLRRISLNLTRSYFRQASRAPTVELSAETPCPLPTAERRLEQRQLVEVVAGAMRAMPGLRRDIFIKRRLHGQPTKEVAAALGLSPGAVDAHVARAVLDLYRTIERLEQRGGPASG